MPNTRNHLQLERGGEWEREISRGGLKNVSDVVENVGGSVDPREGLKDHIIQKVISFLEVGLNEDQKFLFGAGREKGIMDLKEIMMERAAGKKNVLSFVDEG